MFDLGNMMVPFQLHAVVRTHLQGCKVDFSPGSNYDRETARFCQFGCQAMFWILVMTVTGHNISQHFSQRSDMKVSSDFSLYKISHG